MVTLNDPLAAKIRALESKIDAHDAQLDRRLKKIEARIAMIELGLHTLHDFIDRISAVFAGQPNA